MPIWKFDETAGATDEINVIVFTANPVIEFISDGVTLELLPSDILELIQNEIKLPIIFDVESEKFVHLNISFELNPEIVSNILIVTSGIYTFSFINALELGIQFDFINVLNFDLETSFSFKNSLTSKVSLSYSFMNRMLTVNEVEKNFTFFNRILTDDLTIPSPQEYSEFYFLEIHGV